MQPQTAASRSVAKLYRPHRKLGTQLTIELLKYMRIILPELATLYLTKVLQ